MESPRRDGAPAYAAESTLVSRARTVPDVSFRRVLRTRTAPRLLLSGPGGADIAGWGAAATLTADGSNRFERVRRQAADRFAGGNDDVPEIARPRFLGGFAFRDDHEEAPPWVSFPGAWFVLPRVQLVRTDDETWLTVTEHGPDADPESVRRTLDDVRGELASLETRNEPEDANLRGIAETNRTTGRAAWNEQVTAAVKRIERGDLSKVVLAQALTATPDAPFSVPDVLARLGERYPDCYGFLVEPTDDAAFLGATPERLVSLRDGTVETEALAGSIRRGETPAADDALAAELAESGKVREEHGLVADAIREQLAGLSAAVTVGERTVRKLANVQHLRTPIRADVPDGTHVLDVVEALHPTPAVGGVPPAEALETIRGTETFDRGWYAAPVGWFDADGNGAFSVGIRSAVSTGDAATLFAGNGIVADSDPDAEWEEIQLKFRPILDALGAE